MPEPKIAGRKSIKVHLETGEYWSCACGECQVPPFCDGSHEGGAFLARQDRHRRAPGSLSLRLQAPQTPPYCDDTHRELG